MHRRGQPRVAAHFRSPATCPCGTRVNCRPHNQITTSTITSTSSDNNTITPDPGHFLPRVDPSSAGYNTGRHGASDGGRAVDIKIGSAVPAYRNVRGSGVARSHSPHNYPGRDLWCRPASQTLSTIGPDSPDTEQTCELW